MLQSLHIENYKSLHNISINLPSFAALVGPNAAGKSNFVDAIEFLSIVAQSGLPKAVTDKGGYENICFRRTRRAKGAIRFDFRVDGLKVSFSEGKGQVREYEVGFRYEFSFRAAGRAISTKYEVEEERMWITYADLKTGRRVDNLPLYEYPLNGLFLPRADPHDPGPLIPDRQVMSKILESVKDKKPGDDLLLTTLFRGWPPFVFLVEYLSSMRVFQVMPSYARRPASASGSSEMGKYGENLPAALKNLQRESDEAFSELQDNLRLAVPTMERIETGYTETRELGLFLKESGMTRRLYSSELSDGTLRTIGIFLPLTDPSYTLVVIEEPENCTHPWITRQFVTSCREHSAAKQILLTTHSPVLVSQLTAAELFLVDKSNGETLVRPVPREDMDRISSGKVMDLGKYWDSGALGGVPALLELFDPKNSR
jgi:predicted ATPase